MKRCVVLLVVLAVVFLGAMGISQAGEWRFPIGLSYVSGFSDIVDLYEDNLRAEGYHVDSAEGVPVGLTAHPYYQLDSGVGFGGSIGPVMMIFGDADMFILPVGGDIRWELPTRFSASPYVRTGFRYHIASGDYVEDSKPGFFGGVGATFLRDRKIGMGFEIAIDTSTVEFEDNRGGGWGRTEDIEPAELMISIYAVL